MTMTPVPVAPEATNLALRRLASLLRPVDGPDDATIWVHEVLPRGLTLPGLLAAAARREWMLQRVRRRAGARRERLEIHRCRPGMTRTGPRARVLGFLRSGAVVELSATRGARDIDRIAEACGASLRGDVHVGAGGVVRADATIAGRPALLRIAGNDADLAPHLQALHRLGGTAGCVPRLLTCGSSETSAWTAESVLPGRRPRRLTPSLFADAVAFECSLPRAAVAAASLRPDLMAMADLFPPHESRLTRLADAVDAGLQHVPSVVGHGDLWSGNLLVRDGRLSGVVDWDAYSDCVVPGVDLLHLFATEVSIRLRRPRGTIFLDHPWAGEEFRDATSAYWRAIGIRLTPALLASVSVAWWARQTMADLRRNPWLCDDARWVSANIDDVVEGHMHERL